MTRTTILDAVGPWLLDGWTMSLSNVAEQSGSPTEAEDVPPVRVYVVTLQKTAPKAKRFKTLTAQGRAVGLPGALDESIRVARKFCERAGWPIP